MENNTWTFQTTSFSELALAAPPCRALGAAQLRLGKLDKASANTLSFKGELSLAAGELAALDPIADGIRGVLSDSTGGSVDLKVLGGAYDSAARLGWKVNRAGTTWTYKNASKELIPVAGRMGITKAVVKKSSRTPGLVSIAVTGKNASYALAPPVTQQVVLEEQGACFEAAPACTYNRASTTLTCK